MKYVVETDKLLLTAYDTEQTIEVGSADWFNWLEENDRFIYQGEKAHFSVRREARRGHYYWYGYRRHKARLQKVYLGRTADLTLETLMAAGDRIGEEGHADPPGALALLPARLPAMAANATPTATAPRAMMNWLMPPTLPDNVIARPRLLARMSAPVVLVTAPSGYGKTTLLNQWRQAFGGPVAWVSLDTEANTVQTFWAAVVLAWQKIDPGAQDSVLSLLTSSAATPIDPLLTYFVELLHRTQAGIAHHRRALIIDNYQRAQHPEIDATLRRFLDYLPPGISVVIASQRQLPFDVQRWRGKGVLSELSQDDLRLTPEEGLAYLDTVAPADLTQREKLSLVMRTDGWAAGLNLLLLALRRREQVHGFVATFSGHDEYLHGYVAGEILPKHPPERQEFLLKTSILKILTGAQCDALTGRHDGAAMIEELYRANQFVSLIDETRGWYQYHDLFAKALQDQLRAPPRPAAGTAPAGGRVVPRQRSVPGGVAPPAAPGRLAGSGPAHRPGYPDRVAPGQRPPRLALDAAVAR